jgi:hypothetical protein
MLFKLVVPGTVSDTYIKRTLDERPTRTISMNEHGEDIRFVPGNLAFFFLNYGISNVLRCHNHRSKQNK